MSKRELIDEIIEAATTKDGEYRADHAAKLLAERYQEDPDLAEEIAVKAARQDLSKWEHSHAPKRREIEGQGTLFYDPQAILVLGDNERVMMAKAKPVHARRRVLVLTRNLRAQIEAMQTELSYWDDRLDDWPEKRTLDQIERDRFGYGN